MRGNIGYKILKRARGEALGAAARIYAAIRALWQPQRTGPTLLFIDSRTPDPRSGAGFPRARAIIDALLEDGWRVSHVSTSEGRRAVGEMRWRMRRLIEIESAPTIAVLGHYLRKSAGKFDVIFVSRPPNMEMVRDLLLASPPLLGKARLVYDAEAIFSVREALRRAIFSIPAVPDQYAIDLQAEVDLATLANVVTVVSEHEAAEFRRFRKKDDIRVLGLGFETEKDRLQQFDETADLLFVGRLVGSSRESPNVDSLTWFLGEIWPLLITQLPSEACISIVGELAAPELDRFACARVKFLGKVDDLTPLYRKARVFIAPTRFCAGIPVKVIEAAAVGIPCVTTSIIASQAGLLDGISGLSADSARQYAEQCARLYSNPELWRAVQNAAFELVKTRYNSEQFKANLRAACNTKDLSFNRVADQVPSGWS